MRVVRHVLGWLNGPDESAIAADSPLASMVFGSCLFAVCVVFSRNDADSLTWLLSVSIAVAGLLVLHLVARLEVVSYTSWAANHAAYVLRRLSAAPVTASRRWILTAGSIAIPAAGVWLDERTGHLLIAAGCVVAAWSLVAGLQLSGRRGQSPGPVSP